VKLCEAVCLNGSTTLPPVDPPCAMLCGAAYDVLDRAVASPEQLPLSDLTIALPLAVQRCMHYFCVAVLMSILCSVLVEHLDDRQRRAISRGESAASSPVPAMALLLSHEESISLPDSSVKRVGARCGVGATAVHGGLLVAQLVLTCCAISLPLVTRRITGAVPALLNTFGAELGGSFSLLQLGALVGAAGGWDALLTVALWTVAIICPVLRPLSQLCVLLSPTPLVRLHVLSRYISFYHATEVLLAALPVVQVTLHIIFIDLITPRTFPLCALLMSQAEEQGGQCVHIELTLGAGFYLVAASVGLHLVWL